MSSKKAVVVAIELVAIVAAALLWLPIEDDTTLTNAIVIERPPAAVFTYVTTPGNWPNWHPASKAVSGASDHPLAAGEKVTEDSVVAGRAGRVVWTVVKRDAPREWVIQGDVGGHKAGVITYSLTAVPEGTRFERKFVYPARSLLFAILNRVSIGKQVEQESDRAVHNLNRAVESLA